MFNEEALKDLARDPRLKRIAPILYRAAFDEHYRNGLLTAASKAVSPDYAEFLRLAINRISTTGLTGALNSGLQTPILNEQQGGLFNAI